MRYAAFLQLESFAWPVPVFPRGKARTFATQRQAIQALERKAPKLIPSRGMVYPMNAQQQIVGDSYTIAL